MRALKGWLVVDAIKKIREFMVSKVGAKQPASGALVQQRAHALKNDSLRTLVLCMKSHEIPHDLTSEVIAFSSDLHQFGLLSAPTAIKPSEEKAIRLLRGHFAELASKVHAYEPGCSEGSVASLPIYIERWMEFFPEKAMRKLPQSVRLHFDSHFLDLKDSCSTKDLAQFKLRFESMERALRA